MFYCEHETNTKRINQRNNSNAYKIRISSILCILHEATYGATNGAQNKNVNIYIFLL